MSRAIGARAEEDASARSAWQRSSAASTQPEAAERLLDGGGTDRRRRACRVRGFRRPHRLPTGGLALLAGAFARSIEIADAGLARAARADGSVSGRGSCGQSRSTRSLPWDAGTRPSSSSTNSIEAIRWIARMAVQNFVDVLVRQGRVAEASAAIAHDGLRIRHGRGGRGHPDQPDPRGRTARVAGTTLEPPPMRRSRCSRIRRARCGALAILELCVAGEADRAELARSRRRTAEEAEARRVGLARLELLRARCRGSHRTGRCGPAHRGGAGHGGGRGQPARGQAGRGEVGGGCASPRSAWAALGDRLRSVPTGRSDARRRGAASMRRCLCCVMPIASPCSSAPARSWNRSNSLPVEPASASRLRHRNVGSDRRRRRKAWSSRSRRGSGRSSRWSRLATPIARSAPICSSARRPPPSTSRNAMDKLGALSRYDAAAIASRLGLLDVSQASDQAPDPQAKLRVQPMSAVSSGPRVSTDSPVISRP